MGILFYFEKQILKFPSFMPINFWVLSFPSYIFRSKKWDVPLEKIYNKTQRDKFRWAIDMATADFRF